MRSRRGRWINVSSVSMILIDTHPVVARIDSLASLPIPMLSYKIDYYDEQHEVK